MVCPLVEYVERRAVYQICHAVLGDYREAQRGYQLVYSMVYLAVDVVRSAREHDYFLTLAARVGDYL